MTFKVLWLLWVAMFAVLETAAILLGSGTLTETIVENIHWEISIAMFGALAVWLPAHFYAAYRRRRAADLDRADRGLTAPPGTYGTVIFFGTAMHAPGIKTKTGYMVIKGGVLHHYLLGDVAGFVPVAVPDFTVFEDNYHFPER